MTDETKPLRPGAPAARSAIWRELEAIAKRITNHYTAGTKEDQQLGVAITDLREALRAGADDREPARPVDTALVRDMESRIQELNGHAAVYRTMREWAHEESALARANEVWKWLTRLKSRAAALDAAPQPQNETRRAGAIALGITEEELTRPIGSAAGFVQSSGAAAVRRALARVVADGGEERFIGEGYEAHDAIVETVCEELAGAAGTVPPSAPTETP